MCRTTINFRKWSVLRTSDGSRGPRPRSRPQTSRTSEGRSKLVPGMRRPDGGSTLWVFALPEPVGRNKRSALRRTGVMLPPCRIIAAPSCPADAGSSPSICLPRFTPVWRSPEKLCPFSAALFLRFHGNGLALWNDSCKNPCAVGALRRSRSRRCFSESSDA